MQTSSTLVINVWESRFENSIWPVVLQRLKEIVETNRQDATREMGKARRHTHTHTHTQVLFHCCPNVFWVAIYKDSVLKIRYTPTPLPSPLLSHIHLLVRLRDLC